MKLHFVGERSGLLSGIQELAPELGIQLSEDGMAVEVGAAAGGGLEVGQAGDRAYIRYGSRNHFFRGLGLLVQHGRGGQPFEIRERAQFDTIGPMFDLSRNGVLTVESFKLMLRKMALMGLNTVMLYLEDTYEIEGEPYFGYMRGRYTQAELREIDAYADLFGIEAFPSIQTLAHLEEFLKWEPVKEYRDTKGALLVGEEGTGRLVERMIEAASAPFRSRKIHIGMDEAEELGRGKYLDKHGCVDRFDIMTEHLERVLQAVRRRGLKPMMWSDMFLKLASHDGSEYYDHETQIPEEMARRVPKDVDMVYWDYTHVDRLDYERLIGKHRPLGCNLVFAGAVWVFNTFGVNYGLSLKAADAALQVCKEQGIREVYATMWGDDGMESSPFAALLGLQFYAEHAYAEGHPDWKTVEERVLFCTGTQADTFLQLKLLDETPGSEPDNRKQSNPSKFLLYQDVLLGLFDKQIEGLPIAAHYEKVERLIAGRRTPEAELDYLFEVPQLLCRVLKHKGELGLELKRAYDNGDTAALRQIAEVRLPEIAEAVRELRAAHRSQWLRMFKPFGWEVLDIRYGGVISRLDTAAMRLLEYVEGRLPRIEELEQERLLYSSANRFNNRGLGWSSYYYRMASPNVFFHVLNPF
ncbi:Glycosyl hydrolase family 20, catalytic domain [Paenibacillus sp. UNCCL117]|uniref:beta-N-acetylhexosaminidase n=1 Tax=unclassified Paenibacillus TaxID=185978 RepID=UPI000887DDD1|nr:MULTISPECIES: beta-N-acetylhexosaminidase [unclassified Paenibacillus]SDD11778.1 Glycosyl hydrolase family 20, catalytic domain [Paenibacillus sp. cl123]SFW33652.1 Glycosyl hydrolase family 20, catalytic domain [Paenibacillus sp. UNCCL117]